MDNSNISTMVYDDNSTAVEYTDLTDAESLASKSRITDYWMPSESSALIHALVASFSVVMVSELGDKTFFITAIMAMRNSQIVIFLASASALFLMTLLSVVLGVAVTVIPKIYTHYISIILFIIFGLKMLKEAYDMVNDTGETDEFEEVKKSLETSTEEETKKVIYSIKHSIELDSSHYLW